MSTPTQPAASRANALIFVGHWLGRCPIPVRNTLQPAQSKYLPRIWFRSAKNWQPNATPVIDPTFDHCRSTANVAKMFTHPTSGWLRTHDSCDMLAAVNCVLDRLARLREDAPAG